MKDINSKIQLLIKKARECGDLELASGLIELAADLLDCAANSEPLQTDTGSVPINTRLSTPEDAICSTGVVHTPSKDVSKPPTRSEVPDFSMKSENAYNDGKSGKPMEVKDRVNEFVDDGSEQTEENESSLVTPNVTPVSRDRPKFEKVEQVCYVCNKKSLVHPQMVREFFKCDACMRK